MTAISIHLRKEAHHLFWPWLALMSLALIALWSTSWNLKWLSPGDQMRFIELGVFAGIPLLAALGFGAEFQYNTLNMALVQPIERAEIWHRKFIAMVFAILPVSFLFVAGQRLGDGFEYDRWFLVMAWMVVSAASAIFWTLIARSTIGGAALTVGTTGIVLMSVSLAAEYLIAHGLPASQVKIAAALLAFGYAILMVWLGRTTFLRFQCAHDLQSVETYLPGGQLVPAALIDVFRCRPQGLVRNLVRRELRLLRFVWPLSLLSLAAWICLVVFHVVPLDDVHKYRAAYLALAFMINMLIALLAGALSLGEEKSWGTHEWHLTLPVSPSLLWSVKLGVAIVASVVCAALVPMTVLFLAVKVTGEEGLFVAKYWLFWPSATALVTFAAFWAACLLKDTVRSALAALPFCGVAFGGFFAGDWFGELIQSAFPRLFAALVAKIGPIETTQQLSAYLRLLWQPTFLFTSAIVALVGIALVQSHRMFREQATDSMARSLPRIASLFAVTVIATTALNLLAPFYWELMSQERELTLQLHWAIEHNLVNTPQNSRPQVISGQQLVGSLPVSPQARQWLADANVLIVLPTPQAIEDDHTRFLWGISVRSTKKTKPYSAVIRFGDRSTCTFTHRQGWTNKFGLNIPGFLNTACD